MFPMGACIETVRKYGIASGIAFLADLATEPTIISNHGYLLSTETLSNRANLRIYADGYSFAWENDDLERLDDPILEQNGIFAYKLLSKPENLKLCEELKPLISIWHLSCRLGISLIVLEQLMNHLSNRISFGQKTNQHQMIKQEVSEFLIIFTSLQTQLETPSLSSSAYAYMHEELDYGMKKIIRLMGGHGFLSNGIHQYGYISDLMRNLYRMENEYDG